MKSLFVCFLLFISWNLVKSQDMIYYKGVEGTPLRAINYEEVIGSPYYINNGGYKTGRVYMSSNLVYEKGLLLRYNLLTDELTFKYEKDAEMKFTQRPLSFILFFDNNGKNAFFSRGFVSKKDPKGETFYQVLVNRKFKLLKLAKKYIQERTDYGKTTPTKTIQTFVKYYLYDDKNNMTEINDYKSFFRLSDKLKYYAQQKEMNSNTEDNFIELADYYNDLQ
ncbi:hypothetical protein [Pedobacter montanisoli]|uniref:DUF4369 domain-containing protein n=1 Tax=Pedobacter montanisoli TaxID=2923277 RepID=A0ABS9ZTU4_9SPHI|nr:hypothetical protein [Pedobacter montanisoli]MCJ0741652.1 hypothetical protein [Pedobacter montanisoli]